MKKHIKLIFFLGVVGIYLNALGQSVPALVNYQGRLANPDGTALATGDYQLMFRVYDSATNSGGLVWGPQIFDGVPGQGHGGKIPVVQGYFNVMLGPVDTNGVSLASAFNANNRFVEVTVSNRPPILPRQQILTAPFAFRSASAATVDDGAISLAKLAARQVGTNVGVGGFAISEDSGVQDFATTGTFDVTNLTVTLTTTGRPVYVGLASGTNDILNTPSYLAAYSTTVSNPQLYARLVRGTNLIYRAQLSVNTVGATAGQTAIPPSACTTVDFAPGGTWTYTFQIEATSTRKAQIGSLRLFAFEL